MQLHVKYAQLWDYLIPRNDITFTSKYYWFDSLPGWSFLTQHCSELTVFGIIHCSHITHLRYLTYCCLLLEGMLNRLVSSFRFDLKWDQYSKKILEFIQASWRPHQPNTRLKNVTKTSSWSRWIRKSRTNVACKLTSYSRAHELRVVESVGPCYSL